MKFTCRLLIIVLLASAPQYSTQNTSKPKRTKMWFRRGNKGGPSNPYIDKKAKNKPSAMLARQEKKDLRRQKRKFKRDLRRARRKGRGGL